MERLLLEVKVHGMERLLYMNNEMYKEAVCEFEKATRMPDGHTVGTNSYLANYNIGVIYE